MIDMLKLEKSRKLYEEAKAYFASQNVTECVIEISDKPMSDWVVHFTETEEGMYKARTKLINSGKQYIAIYDEPEGKYFYFSDYIIRSLELLNTGTFEYFHVSNFDREQVVKEFLELKKMLQGS